jgi:multidrug efflux system membrane fusion protein
LVTLNEIKPIRAQLAVPQNYLAPLRKAMAGEAPEVVATIDNDKNPVTGKLTYIDNQVDAASGTFVARATFDNIDERLWPGMFVNLTVRLGIQPDAITVPETAVQHGQQGDYMFAVVGGKAVKMDVTVTRTMDGIAVINANVKPGDMVVTDGTLTLKDGDTVSVRYPDAPKDAAKDTATDKPAEQAKTDTPKDAPKVEQLIPEAPKADAPKTDAPKTDKPQPKQ